MSEARPRVYPLAYALAIWFGCGRVPKAPGTAGTLGAIPLYLAIRHYGGGAWAVGLAALVVAAVGIWAGGHVARALAAKDPQIICIDEVAGVLVTLIAAPPGWPGLIAGVVLFRIADMTKPWPARAAEGLPGGWGVVMDDLVAGVWGLAALLGLRAAGVL